MRLASGGSGGGWWERQAFRWFRLRKRVHQLIRYRRGEPKVVALIVGCQRSGTSLLSHLFRLDRRVVTYDEVSPLSRRDPAGLRLDPLPEVVSRIGADRAPLVVLKPLVESQRLAELLDGIPESRAIWMCRHYRDVAASNLRFFGRDNGLRDLAPVVAGERGDWRLDGCRSDAVEMAVRLHEEGLSEFEAAAVFWWLRNRLYFDQGLDGDPRVLAVDYDDLVEQPGPTMARIYAFLGRTAPRTDLAGAVLPSRHLGDGAGPLRDEIEELCGDMLHRLRGAAGKGESR